MAVAAAIGVVFGYLTIRRQGIYFAMITLAFAQMVYFFCVQAPFTGGEDGIQAVPRGHLFGFIDLNNTYAMYYFVLAVFLFGFWLIYRTIHSPFGQVMKAIRENEPRAISLGYRVEYYKLLAFVLSAALAGLAGSVKALVFQFASLTDVFWTTSGEVVLMTLLGGIGTILGPVVGAFIIVTMETYLAQTGSWVTIIQGVIFVVCVLDLPRRHRRRDRALHRRQAGPRRRDRSAAGRPLRHPAQGTGDRRRLALSSLLPQPVMPGLEPGISQPPAGQMAGSKPGHDGSEKETIFEPLVQLRQRKVRGRTGFSNSRPSAAARRYSCFNR